MPGASAHNTHRVRHVAHQSGNMRGSKSNHRILSTRFPEVSCLLYMFISYLQTLIFFSHNLGHEFTYAWKPKLW